MEMIAMCECVCLWCFWHWTIKMTIVYTIKQLINITASIVCLCVFFKRNQFTFLFVSFSFSFSFALRFRWSIRIVYTSSCVPFAILFVLKTDNLHAFFDSINVKKKKTKSKVCDGRPTGCAICMSTHYTSVHIKQCMNGCASRFSDNIEYSE